MNMVGRWIGVASIAGGLLLGACSDDGTSVVVADEPGDVPDTSAESPTAESPDYVAPGDDWTCVTETSRATDDNQALTVELCVSDVDVAVGEIVQVSVHAEDPDAEIDPFMDCRPHQLHFGESPAGCIVTPGCLPRSGEPQPKRGLLEETATHSYDAAGTYRIEAFVISGKLCPHLYSNQISASVDVTVT